MPKMVAHTMENMESPPALLVWRGWGERLRTRLGDRWKLCLVSDKISERKARGGEGRLEWVEAGGPGSVGVLV